MQRAASALVIYRPVQQARDQVELLLSQREHGAAPGHVVHPAQLGDHRGEPVHQPG